jgi:asparagine N-glycosylation enzyme membrane subunit Stt3
MRIPMTVALTDTEPFTVSVGFKAQGAAESRYNFAISKANDTGIRQEWWAYMAWTQAVTEGKYLGPWDTFWNALDDITMSDTAPDPTGPVAAG